MKFLLLLQYLLSLIGLALAVCHNQSINFNLKSRAGDDDTITDLTCGQSWLHHPRRRHHHHQHRKIMGGRNAEAGEFPYQVNLAITLQVGPEEHFMNCGGSLIDDRHILTAAHCLTVPNITRPIKRVLAFLAPRDMTRNEFIVTPLKSFKVHSEWNYDAPDGEHGFDIAMLKTAEPVKFVLHRHGLNSVNRICLPAKDEDLAPVGTTLTVSGFGLVQKNTFAERLQTTEVRVIDFMDGCDFYHGMKSEHYLCLKTLVGRSSNVCHGDSGGPAAIKRDGKWFLVGLTSQGRGYCKFSTCYCLPEYPVTFTRISAFIDWIEATKQELAAPNARDELI